MNEKIVYSLDNSKYVYKCRTNNTVDNIFNKESRSVIIFEIGIESVGSI